MLRVLRILEIAFRFAHVRIVFLALSRSVKLIFHVVLLTVVLNYFFALIALYLTQFGLNNTSYGDKEIIQSLFGTGEIQFPLGKLRLKSIAVCFSPTGIHHCFSSIH